MINKWENPWAMTREQLLAKWNHVLEWSDHIFTWTSNEELSLLCEFASRSTSILEVGSYHGRSALVMALANPNARIICIDNCENADVEPTFAKNLATQIAAGKLHFVKGTSDELKHNTVLFDFAWIDGGHLLADVRKDIANILPHMMPRSILCGHDYRINDPQDGVNLAVHEAFDKSQLRHFQSIWMAQLP